MLCPCAVGLWAAGKTVTVWLLDEACHLKGGIIKRHRSKCVLNYPCLAWLTSGCDDIGNNDIGHNRKPYRPHGKSISATPCQPQNIWRVYYAHVYVVSYSVSCRLYLSALSVVIRRDLFVSLFRFCVCQYETVVVNTTFSCHYRMFHSYKALQIRKSTKIL